MQRQTAVRNVDEPETTRIEFRVDTNPGSIIVEAGDIYGGDVNIAARLERLAEPGSGIPNISSY